MAFKGHDDMPCTTALSGGSRLPSSPRTARQVRQSPRGIAPGDRITCMDSRVLHLECAPADAPAETQGRLRAPAGAPPAGSPLNTPAGRSAMRRRGSAQGCGLSRPAGSGRRPDGALIVEEIDAACSPRGGGTKATKDRRGAACGTVNCLVIAPAGAFPSARSDPEGRRLGVPACWHLRGAGICLRPCGSGAERGGLGFGRQ